MSKPQAPSNLNIRCVLGVLQREETNLAYGSMDNGKTVYADPQFHELMHKAALQLHIKEHELVDGSGKSST